MILKVRPHSLVPLALIGLAFTLTQAKAAITVTFSYNGINTIGVVSGSITLPSLTSANDLPNNGPTFIDGGERTLYVHTSGDPSYDYYVGGSNPSSVQITSPNLWSGNQSFGFIFSTLYAPFSAVPGSVYTPTGTLTWSNQTLAQVGVSGLTTPIVAYRASNGEEIRFVTAVPEPGTALLSAIGAIGLLRRRR
jgi:hypothetical protein